MLLDMAKLGTYTVAQLREGMAELHTQARALNEAAVTAKRDMTAEENSKFTKMYDDYDKVKDELDKRLKAHEARSRMDAAAAFLAADSRSTTDRNLPGTEQRGGGDQVIEFRGQKLTLAAGTVDHQRCTAEYREVMQNYLRTGEIRHGMINGSQQRGMAVGVNSMGGYLSTMQMIFDLLKFVDNAVLLRSKGTVYTVQQATSLGVPTWDTDPGDADWTAEVPSSDISEDTAARVGRRELMPHLLTKLVKISQTLLLQAIIDPEALITQRLAYKFGVTEEKGFMTGNGSQQPLGLFTASAAGISTGRDVTVGSTTAITADGLINTFFALKPQYQARAEWAMHRDAVKGVRTLKDSQNNYIWHAGLSQGTSMQVGAPDTLLGRPLNQSEYAPNTFTTGLYVAIVGDFKFYWIADALQFTVQRLNELFGLKNQVGFVGRKMTDGMPVLEEAFSRGKLA